ncbi:Sac2 family-domain-containing protein [Melampsora americana]|nr:Sac2 family-domain-containing protein [Melampsora americana]
MKKSIEDQTDGQEGKSKDILKILNIDTLNQESIIKKILESFTITGINSNSNIYNTLASQDTFHDQLSTYLDCNLYQFLNHPLHQSESDLESNELDQFIQLKSYLQSSQLKLNSLTSFLNSFQSDLSIVSSSISELQRRSKLLESQLDFKRSSLTHLNSFILETLISPDLIHVILNSQPSVNWFKSIDQLEFHLLKSKSNRIENHPSLIILDKLSLLASFKIRSFFLNALKPFRTSVSTNLQITQASVFLKHRSLFGFLQRHATRTAHEVQKAYIGTVKWYLETGMRRYVRALEKIRIRGWIKLGTIGVNSPGSHSTSIPSPDSIIQQAFIEGPDLILAHMADSNEFKQSPEALFRSISLVVIDNITVEYQFVKHFFGLPLPPSDQHPTQEENQAEAHQSMQSGLNSRSRASSISHQAGSIRRGSTVTARYPRAPPSMISSFTESELSGMHDSDHQPALEHLWKQIVEPVLEYHKTFTQKILESSMDTTSLYCMIKLNERLMKRNSRSNQTLIETHLMSLKFLIWPVFQGQLNLEKESIKRLIENEEFEGLMRFGKKYGRLVCILIGICGYTHQEEEEEGGTGIGIGGIGEGEEEERLERQKKEEEEEEQRREEELKVFRELGLIREMMDKVIEREMKVKDVKKGKLIERFYGEIIEEILAYSFTHFYLQGELAHWKEMLRRIQSG